jgi:hypothetical protein
LTYNGDASLKSQRDYAYTNAGNTTLDQYREGGVELWAYRWDYNSAELVEMKNYSEKGQELWRHEYAYDSAGNMTMSKYCDKRQVTEWWEYEYNSAKKAIHSTRYYADKSVYEEYRYGDDGKLLLSEFVRNQARVFQYWREYEYNEQNWLTSKREYDESQNLQLRHIYEYDPLGQIVHDTVTDNAGTEVSWLAYEYFYFGE